MDDKYYEWDPKKQLENILKHHISFDEAKEAFEDASRVIKLDLKHSVSEFRYFCFGLVKSEVMTVRFTIRTRKIRIIGAAYWRGGRKIYEKENSIRGKSLG